MSTPTVLPVAAWPQQVAAPAAPVRFLRPALVRAGCYLLPVPLAMLAAGWLEPVPWPALAGTLAVGWAALWLLAGTGLAGAGLARSARSGRIGGRTRLPRRLAYLALGLAQAAAVVLVWKAGQAGAPAGVLVPPALLPVLVAVPLIQLLVGWHLARVATALGAYEERDGYLRYARRLGWATLAALLPPLVAGAALAGTATRLPYRLSAHPDAPALVLAMAGGVLLAGVLAVGWLLAARGRPGAGAAVTLAPVLGTLALAASVPGLLATSLEGWGQLLPVVVVALSVGYAAGLVLVTQVGFGEVGDPD